MTRIRISAIASLAIVCLAAVIPLRSALSHPAALDNPYAGSWAGPYTYIPNEFTGYQEFTVTDEGVTEGTFGPLDGPPAGWFRGVILSDGSFHAVGHGEVPGPGSSGQEVDGTVSIDSRGHMLMEFGPRPKSKRSAGKAPLCHFPTWPVQ